MANPIKLKAAFPRMTACIFDMDDLMIDSHPLHMKVFYEVMLSHGADTGDDPLTPAEEASLFGLKISDAFKVFSAKYGIATDTSTLQSEFDALMLPVFERSAIEPMPGLVGLLRELTNVGLPLALASSARAAKIEIVLRKLALDSWFKTIVSGEDEIEKGKPAPDIFLAAARKLEADPLGCVVFEDAQNGVRAAKAAGMFVVGVHNAFSAERLGLKQDLSEADIQVDSLEEVTLA